MSPSEAWTKVVDFTTSPMTRREGYLVVFVAVVAIWYLTQNGIGHVINLTDQTFASHRASIAEHHDRIQALEAGRAAAP